MIISTDGACKRQGTPQCSACGVAWIHTADDNFIAVSAHEKEQSTSQRGELMGLIMGLTYAANHAEPFETITLITDSEYLFNTVSKDWAKTWKAAGWESSTGTTVKNVDLWENVLVSLSMLEAKECYVAMQWTKGHLMSYHPRNIKTAMIADDTGLELYTCIKAIASRQCEATLIATTANQYRVKHDHLALPAEIITEFVVMNVTADALAGYIMACVDVINL